MKLLIAYPNLPMMLTPAVSVGIFTAIALEYDCDVRLFETTTYTDDNQQGMVFKSKLGGGRAYSEKDLQTSLKPTSQMIPDFVECVESYEPDLILFSTVEDTFKDTILMLESIAHLNVKHLVGGVFPINAPEICLKNEFINAICRYEGELVLRDVIESDGDLENVSGVWTKTKRNKLQPLAEINDVIPNYMLYDEDRFNRPIGGKIVRAIQLETYRGCPYSCTFCNSPMTRFMDKNYLRRKSVEQMRIELEYYVRKFSPEYWFIIDDSFLARPRKETLDLLELLKEFGISWWCNTRIENVDAEILQAMKEAHCDRIQFGVECGNEEYRKDVLKRPIKNSTYYEKGELINASGIPYGLNVIIGLPGETRELVFETIDMIKTIKGYDGLGISIFIPYHGTELRTYAVDRGWLDDSWISGDGYLLGGSALNMPKPYLSKDEIWNLSLKFKLFCFFDHEHWDDIEENADKWEVLYEQQFYSKFAVGGKENIKRRSVYGCEADPYVDSRNAIC